MDRTQSLVFGLFALALGCGASSPEASYRRTELSPPARPSDCREVPLAEALGPLLAASTPGTALCLSPGVRVGKLSVPEGVTLWGPREAVIKTTGEGTTVKLASGARLLGLTVDGSGGRHDVLDAAVHLGGDDISVEGLLVRNSIFGILSEKSKRARIRGNHVIGTGGAALGMRGDGIRLWETQHSLVEGNFVEQSRDCIVWYSNDNTIVGNEVRGGRYGTHIMYGHRNRVANNVYAGNEVAIFAMYSRNLVIEDNALLGSGGTAGMGLGVKESGNLTVRRNLMLRNTQAIFLDTSPLEPADRNLFEQNEVRLSEAGVVFLSSQHDNLFRQNTFHDNRTQVRVDGGGDALSVVWEENDWDDYAGYDLDGDGVGDVPYEQKDLSGALLSRHADLAFLEGSPALGLISVAGQVAPLLMPRPLLRDERPRMKPMRSTDAH